MLNPDTCLDDFAVSLKGEEGLAGLRKGVIGEGVPVPGPFGDHPLLYADYVASGRALQQVESFVLTQVEGSKNRWLMRLSGDFGPLSF